MPNNDCKLWLFCLSIISIAWLNQAYETGAPVGACQDMMPGHGIATPQASPSPYIVEVTPQVYTPGDVITVTIKGKTDSDVFQGFLVQARRADRLLDTNALLGSFTEIPYKGKFAACGGNNALTHIDASNKGLLTFTWTAPSTAVGHVVILATIAKTKNVFWVKVTSPVIRDPTAANINTTPPPLPTTSVTQPAVNITPSAPIEVVNPDSQCGREFGCMRQCGEAGCKFVVAWKPLPNGRISFSIQAQVHPHDYYLAVGISADSEMGMDTVFDCIKYNGVVSVQQSYNEGRDNHLYPEPMKGLTVLETSVDDKNLIRCKFERSIDTYKDLRQPWNLLVAHGDVNSAGFKVFHSDTRVSLTRVLLTRVDYDDVKEWGYNGGLPIGGGSEESTETVDPTGDPDIMTPPTGHATVGYVCIHTIALLLIAAVLLA